jgi:hypothetical protein
MKRNTREALANTAGALVLIGTSVALLLAYFDVLVK